MTPMTDRRTNKFRFSKEINLGNVIALIVLSIQCYTIFNKVSAMSFKIDLMWDDYNRRVINRPEQVNNEKISIYARAPFIK